jgi:hypothetical protein
MKNIEQTIQEAVAKVNLRKPETVAEAANIILTEDNYVKGGETVATLDDPSYPYSGQRAKVIGPSDKGSGWVDLEFANGVKMPYQSSLLLKVG